MRVTVKLRILAIEATLHIHSVISYVRLIKLQDNLVLSTGLIM